ncbi:MAG: sel1 repeat family protein, partial [Alphaproteobacteria bacterium]|nr:sel1 repeat family protein [Alphaproteobacteria bacterium]
KKFFSRKGVYQSQVNELYTYQLFPTDQINQWPGAPTGEYPISKENVPSDFEEIQDLECYDLATGNKVEISDEMLCSITGRSLGNANDLKDITKENEALELSKLKLGEKLKRDVLDNVGKSYQVSFRYTKEIEKNKLLSMGKSHYLKNTKDDKRKAREILEEAERREYTDGEMLNILGVIYDSGEGGVAPNYTTANEYYKKARNVKYSKASRDLGVNYYYGCGVTKDQSQALKLFIEAEERGHNKEGDMFLVMGDIYHRGLGVQADKAKARGYYDKGEAQGKKANWSFLPHQIR